MDVKKYQDLVNRSAPKSPILKDCIFAFLIGGGICTLGQVLLTIYENLGAEQDTASTLASVSLIFLSVLLTALGVFDNIAKHAGAGTIVPITGFANSVASPAIEFKSEGWVLGLGAKMFTIAGPVIVYGVSASVVCGIIYYICQII
jgi:stage V sporulation protein AC